MSTPPLFLGIISGQQRRDHAEVADRTDRIAGGLQRLGVAPGDSVCILMRNDIAFIEAAYGAMQLGAYAVPVNWHFKPEEIHYILSDSGTRVLVAHADMLHQLRDSIPEGVTVLGAPTPPEILSHYKIDSDTLATPDFGIDLGPKTLRYPDIVVDPATDAPRDLTAIAPILIAEVLSPSTERVDLGDKAAEYLRLRSLAVYLVFAQDELKAWVWLRGPDDFSPRPQVLTAPDHVVRISPLGSPPLCRFAH